MDNIYIVKYSPTFGRRRLRIPKFPQHPLNLPFCVDSSIKSINIENKRKIPNIREGQKMKKF
jgi:hypothetical protein